MDADEKPPRMGLRRVSHRFTPSPPFAINTEG